MWNDGGVYVLATTLPSKGSIDLVEGVLDFWPSMFKVGEESCGFVDNHSCWEVHSRSRSTSPQLLPCFFVNRGGISHWNRLVNLSWTDGMEVMLVTVCWY